MTTSADRYANPGSSSGMTEMLPLAAPYGVRSFCVVHLLLGISHCDGFSGELLMRTPSGRFVWEQRFASTVLWSFFAVLVFQVLVKR